MRPGGRSSGDRASGTTPRFSGPDCWLRGSPRLQFMLSPRDLRGWSLAVIASLPERSALPFCLVPGAPLPLLGFSVPVSTHPRPWLFAQVAISSFSCQSKPSVYPRFGYSAWVRSFHAQYKASSPILHKWTCPFRVGSLSLYCLVLLWPTAYHRGSWAALWVWSVGAKQSPGGRGVEGEARACVDIWSVPLT